MSLGISIFFDKTGTASYNKGAYYLSKVLDAKNQEIITVEYAEYHYTDEQLPFVDYKPKRIISKGYGEINLEYDYFPQNRYKSNSTHMSDCYRVKKAELKDTENRVVQYIDFTYNEILYYKYSIMNTVTYDTTVLDKISRKTNQGNEIEAYSFTYNTTGTERNYGPSPNFGFDVCASDPEPVREWTDNPKYSTIGTLSKMILPTKGYVKFNFESNQYYLNRTSVFQNPFTGSTNTSYFHDKETQYYKLITSSDFDTKINSTFTFNVTPGSSNYPDHRNLVFCYQVIGYDPNPLLDPDAIPVIALYYDNQYISYEADAYGRMYVPVGLPGQHTLTISGNTTGVGNFSVYELTDIDVSNHNYKSKYGARIKSIEYFDSEASVLPSKSKNYIYKRFSDNETSSGALSPYLSISQNSYLTAMYGDYELNKNIIYKNVKEVDADGGYTKYTFIGLDDWSAVNSSNAFSYLEDMNNSGLLTNKEMYTSTHQKVASENHEYTFENLDVHPFIVANSGGYSSLYPVHVKKHKVINTSYFPQNRSVTTSSETLVNKNDFNVEYTKESNDQGDITETYYDYPYSKQITKLLNKNMYKNLIETRTLFNGEVVSKTESKYDEPSHLFPTSVLSQNLTGSLATQLTYDQYDVNGNLLQYTTKDGVSTAIIWGYNGTLPIAKITGATYAQVSSLASPIIAASDADALAVYNNDETALLNTLDNFRNQPGLSAFQIATYTYDPLTGVRSLTPPSGIREIYIYDSAGRLQKIVDEQGKILKENTYNYKP